MKCYLLNIGLNVLIVCLKGLIWEESWIKLKVLKEIWEFEMFVLIIFIKVVKKLSF